MVISNFQITDNWLSSNKLSVDLNIDKTNYIIFEAKRSKQEIN